MLKAFLALTVFLGTLAAVAQETETAVDQSYDKCLTDTMERFKTQRSQELESEYGKAAGAMVKKTSCDEKTMTCKITGYFQYKNETSKKVIISGQDLSFKVDENGMCVEGVLIGKPTHFSLSGM